MEINIFCGCVKRLEKERIRVWLLNLKQIIKQSLQAIVQDKIFNGEGVTLSYTLQSDDITQGEKVESTPYVSRKGEFIAVNDMCVHQETQTSLAVEEVNDGLKFSLICNGLNISEWGVNLPFNFMGKLNGGGWEKQYLFNSPYASSDNKYIYCYLSNPEGHNILVLAEGDLDGWKMDYSPYAAGHFFYNLKLLAQFDKTYKPLTGRKTLSFYVFEVADFDCALKKVAEVLQLPLIKYEIGGGRKTAWSYLYQAAITILAR